MTELTIVHTAAEGTLLDGTCKGDGAGPTLKAHGWRWFRTVGQWGIVRSRDRRAERFRIDQTAAALRADGWNVTVSVDETPRSFAEAEAERQQHQTDRIDHLASRHDRKAATAEASDHRARDLADRMPLGQPIVNDATRRAYRNINRASSRAAEDYRAEQRSAATLQRAEATASHRYNPATVANRIDRLEASIRDRQRKLSGYNNHLGDQFSAATGAYAERLRADLADLEDQANYWRQIRDDQVADGTASTYSRDTIHAGDYVTVARSGWWQVKRANPKTVTLRSHGCEIRRPYHQLTGHHRPD